MMMAFVETCLLAEAVEVVYVCTFLLQMMVQLFSNALEARCIWHLTHCI